MHIKYIYNITYIYGVILFILFYNSHLLLYIVCVPPRQYVRSSFFPLSWFMTFTFCSGTIVKSSRLELLNT